MLVSLAAASQGPTRPKPPTKPPEFLDAPALDAGVTTEYSDAVYQVELALQTGDFEKAKRLAAVLPHRKVRVVWDDSKVPSEAKFAYAECLTRAFRLWSTGLGADLVRVDPTKDKMPVDLKFSFEPILQTPAGSTVPLGLATFYSSRPTDTRLEAVIGLKRGSPKQPSSVTEVQNDVLFSIGQYFGLAQTPLVGSYMYRVEKPTTLPAMGIPSDKVTAEHNLELGELLVITADHKQKVHAGQASLFVDPKRFDVTDTVIQGDTLKLTIQVSNQGTAPMSTKLIPDCGCFAVGEPIEVAAGSSGLYQVEMRTAEFQGGENRNLFLLTSDRDHPVITIPVNLKIKPRYRFLSDHGNTTLVDSSGGQAIVYMAVEGEPLDIAAARVEGLPATVTYEPWEGTLPDPLMNEGPKHRTGYKITIELGDKVPLNYNPYSLLVTTTDSTFRSLRAQLIAQKGIVALPDQLYLGTLAPIERHFKFILTRPEVNFHVTSVSCDDPHFKVTQRATHGLWEHEFSVVYDGKGSIGEVSATITVKTSDKKQPVFKIPITASIT